MMTGSTRLGVELAGSGL